MSTKQLWILAGGNGAGKSTYFHLFLKPLGMFLINADVIAKTIAPDNTENVSYEAASFAERIRNEQFYRGNSFCFETVFSHKSKIDFVAKAKALGYEVVLYYFHLDTPELNEARVFQRVNEGGHNVPAEKIHSRIPRAVENIAQALLLVDKAKLIDNTSQDNPFSTVALVEKGALVKSIHPLPKWAEEILKNVTSCSF